MALVGSLSDYAAGFDTRMTEVLTRLSVHFCLGSFVSIAMPTIQSMSRSSGKILDMFLMRACAMSIFPETETAFRPRSILPNMRRLNTAISSVLSAARAIASSSAY